MDTFHTDTFFGRLKAQRNSVTLEGLLAVHQGNNVFHVAAGTGYLGHIPKEFLTEENFCIKNAGGNSVLHLAAKHNRLDKVPRQLFVLGCSPPKWIDSGLLSERLVLASDRDGSTVLHIAAETGQLHLIPRSILTESNLMILNKQNKTPLHYVLDGQKTVLHGIEFSRAVEPILGAEWYAKNVALLADKAGLTGSEVSEMEIF